MTEIGVAFSGCTNLKNIYIDNINSNIQFINAYDGNPWIPWYGTVNAQIHYRDCTHSVKLRKYMEDSTEIESVIEGIDNENIPCRSNYQFKLVKDGEVIKDKILKITELGITSYYNVEKEIEPDENSIYTIENMSREYIIEIGEKYQHATDENGITWEYEYEDGKATNVHYYSGDLTGKTEIEIPSTLNGYSVISLNNENSNEEAIGLFGKAWGGPQNVKISEGTITIGNNAFRGYSNLTSIELPNSVSNIGQSAFERCYALQRINLPDSITNIEFRAFYSCSSLENIELPENLTEIKGGAFAFCSSLEELIIPDSVTTIGNSAFDGCNNLSNLTISENISNIFSCGIEYTPYYKNLPDGEFYMGKVLYKYKGEMPENTNITVKDGTTVLRRNTFYGQNNLISIELPDSVTKIESEAFRNCSNLSSVTMSKNIKYIGEAAFDNCTSLSQIVIWKNVEELGYRTFDNWTNEQLINFEVQDVQQGWDEEWNKGCNAQIVFGYTGE